MAALFPWSIVPRLEVVKSCKATGGDGERERSRRSDRPTPALTWAGTPRKSPHAAGRASIGSFHLAGEGTH